MFDNPAVAVIVDAIACVVCAVIVGAMLAADNRGWACLFGGLLVGFVCVLIVDWQDLHAQRRAESRPRVPRPPDFPPQRKHDIC